MTFLMMTLAAVAVGWLAQSRKGRTGAVWGLLTFIIMIPTWFVLYLASHMASPEIYSTDEGWYALGILVSGGVGVVMALLVATFPNKQIPGAARGTRQCPFCAEEIKAEAKICRYCGKEIAFAPALGKPATDAVSRRTDPLTVATSSAELPAGPNPLQPHQSTPQLRMRWLFAGLAVAVLIMALVFRVSESKRAAPKSEFERCLQSSGYGNWDPALGVTLGDFCRAALSGARHNDDVGRLLDEARSTADAGPSASAPPAPLPGVAIHTCEQVDASFASDVGVGQAWAVRASVAHAVGIANSGVVWFVSTPTGATWITDFDPIRFSEGGNIAPLNLQARQTSDIGIDVRSDSPWFSGIRDNHPAAQHSRRCASSRD